MDPNQKKKTDLGYPNTSVDPQADPKVQTAEGTSSGPGAPELSKKADKLREDRPQKISDKDMVTCIAIAPIAQGDGTTAVYGEEVLVSRAFYKQFKNQYVLNQADFDAKEREKRGEDELL